MYLYLLHCCMFILNRKTGLGIMAITDIFPFKCTSNYPGHAFHHTSMWSDPIHADSQAGSDNVKTRPSHLTCAPWAGI